MIAPVTNVTTLVWIGKIPSIIDILLQWKEECAVPQKVSRVARDAEIKNNLDGL
jgi:hypothetical protein